MSFISIDPAQGVQVGHVMVDAANRSLAALQRLSAVADSPGLGAWSGTVASEVGVARASIEHSVLAWLGQGEDMLRRLNALVRDQQASSAIGAVGSQPAAQGLLGAPVVGAMAGYGVAGMTAPGVGGTSISIAGPQNALLGAGAGVTSTQAQELAAAGLPPLLIAGLMGAHIPGGLSFSISGHTVDVSAHSAANAALNGLADGMVASGAISAIPIAPMQMRTFTSMYTNADGDGWVDGMDPQPTYYNPGSVRRG